MFAYDKLPGLPRDRIIEAIEPVLRAHGLAGVELVWRTDGQGRVLQVTLEPAADAEEAPAGLATAEVGVAPAQNVVGAASPVADGAAPAEASGAEASSAGE